MNNYCCDQFHFLHDASSSMGLNVRVVKFGDSYKFWLTEGYTSESRNIKRILITFCPFCGVSLNQTYSSDGFLNEEVEVLKKVFSR